MSRFSKLFLYVQSWSNVVFTEIWWYYAVKIHALLQRFVKYSFHYALYAILAHGIVPMLQYSLTCYNILWCATTCFNMLFLWYVIILYVMLWHAMALEGVHTEIETKVLFFIEFPHVHFDKYLIDANQNFTNKSIEILCDQLTLKLPCTILFHLATPVVVVLMVMSKLISKIMFPLQPFDWWTY